MSKLIADTLKTFFNVGKFIAKGYVLKKEEGARFAKNSEQNEIINSSNRGLLINGINKRLSEKESFKHIAIIAKSGIGKTTGYIYPNIFDKADSNCSMLITDPSSEIYETTSQHLKNRGFKIVRLNPSNINQSSRFNPFHGLGAEDIIEIEQICTSIIKSKYGNDKEQVWNDGAISLLELFAKCLAYTQPEYLNLPNLNYLIQMFGESGENLDDWVIEHSINPYDEQDRSILDFWIGLRSNNANMLTSYATIVKTALKQLNNRKIQRLLSNNDIDLEDFRKQKTAIFLSFPDNQQDYYQFLVDIFYARFFSVMMSKKPTPRDLNVYCFLDEFGNAYVDNFPTIVTTIRKYRVSLSVVLQGISQLNKKYGDMAKSGISSFIIYAGGDYETLNEQSQLIGKKRIIQRNKFEDHVTSYQDIDLLPPAELRTMKDNQALFLSSNKYPFIFEFQPFYKNRKFLTLSKKGEYIPLEKQKDMCWNQLFLKKNNKNK
ncbi:type IV secretory system conjugative DNA transfer family protein [Desulfotalea psychrophila]|uniref:Related to plasmid transfer complex protein TrsK/TraK n=1 Tax=Desulfotalea psychrophila (strain LSv54 / DSM 12343) TaxID=177439 RepID=Q6AI69_DESPS|nr:type IV secretory system conjugative DNA transfer family protein [Desulfotalea psychrophila]CAG37860.1 related to plasmid transfer complex protein TrsK/TraK [Desulfotalea psychrophila LSv54]